jgi:hypothetical protein
MVGVSLKVTGTVQSYVLYYLATDTAARLAEEFSSRPLTPGGDAALGGAADLMQLVASNALEGMKALSQAIGIKVGDIFACAERASPAMKNGSFPAGSKRQMTY